MNLSGECRPITGTWTCGNPGLWEPLNLDLLLEPGPMGLWTYYGNLNISWEPGVIVETWTYHGNLYLLWGKLGHIPRTWNYGYLDVSWKPGSMGTYGNLAAMGHVGTPGPAGLLGAPKRMGKSQIHHKL